MKPNPELQKQRGGVAVRTDLGREDLVRLACCDGIYVHRSTCVNHHHMRGGPPDCPQCRELSKPTR